MISFLACRCFTGGSISPDCDRYGQCQCKKHHGGIKCDRCQKGHYGYPECKGTQSSNLSNSR